VLRSPDDPKNVGEYLSHFRLTVRDHQGDEHQVQPSSKLAAKVLDYRGAQALVLAVHGKVLRHSPAESRGTAGRVNWTVEVARCRTLGVVEIRGPGLDLVEVLGHGESQKLDRK
jgi:hypothetical protein